MRYQLSLSLSFPTNNNNNLDAWPQRNHRGLGRGRVDPGLGNLDLGRGPESARRPGVAPRSTATVRRLLLAWASEGRIDPRSICGFAPTPLWGKVGFRGAERGEAKKRKAPGKHLFLHPPHTTHPTQNAHFLIHFMRYQLSLSLSFPTNNHNNNN